MKPKIKGKIVVLSVLLALIFSAAGVLPAQAAGIYTHSIVVEHAIERLNADGGYSELVDILNSYPDMVNYGAIFPDTTYAGIDGDWSEMLHDTGTVNSNYEKFLQFLADQGYAYNWDLQAYYYKQFLEDPAYTFKLPEFRAALMLQIMHHFNNTPRSADDEKMIAFLFGVIAHQEADSPWHLNCTDPTWRGLECAAGTDLGLDEYKLEMTAKFFDGFHSENILNNVNIVYDTVLAASDARGYRRPYCHTTCVAFPGDPIRTGNFNLHAFWVEPGIPPGWPWQWGGFNDWIFNYVPGGINDGSSLVAGAWMHTWDKLGSANIYYVKPAASGNGNCSSWDNACTLQSALSQAFNGEIWVAAGMHKPTDVATDRTATFRLRTGVAVYGGFVGVITETLRTQRNPAANVTYLSGDLNGDDSSFTNNGENSYHVVTGADGATLDGFTITAGNANGSDCPGTACGGGMQNLEASPTVTNVIFSGNAATYGGGMFNWASSSVAGVNTHPIITNVTFSGNSATTNGGGIYNELSRPLITNVTFSGNTAGGDGGGMYNHTQLIGSDAVRHATFNGNSAFRGGGVYNYYGSVDYRNTIFWGNTATGDGAQVYEESNALTIYNSIVQDGCPVNVDCPSIITADPKLGTLGNYGGFTPTTPLLPGSSAINAGNATYCTSGKDQRDVSYVGVCDIGAFESQGFTLTVTGGDSQSAGINTAFTNPLALTVTSAFGEPVDGGVVAFTPPGSGASAVITGSPAAISSGAASVTATANGTLGGPYNVAASAAGAASVNFSLTNTKIDTTTTLVSSLNPSTFGQSVTFTATVAPTPTGGAVTFKDGGADITGCVNVSLDSGQADCTTSALGAGAHTITAFYSGDANYNSSDNTAIPYSFTVNKALSSVTVICPATPQTYTGSPITPCTASYSGAGGLSGTLTPTYTNNVNVGTATATATYGGDANHDGSSNSATFAIGKTTSTVTVICPETPQTYTGSPITPCTASYSGAGGLSGTLTPTYTNNVNVGTATATATYGGDANHDGSSNSATFEIGKATSTVTVICPATPQTYTGSPITPCTASYSGAGGLSGTLTPTYTNNVNVGTATASATYGGDANHDGSSNSATFEIGKATPVITFGAAPTPVYLGGDFTVSATTTNTDSPILTYSRVSGPCAWVSGAEFSSTGAGTCVVQAHGAATANFTAASQTQNVTILAPLPTLSGIAPNSGPDAGGQTVVITGTNFSGPGFSVSSVTLGGGGMTCAVDSSTQITCANATPVNVAAPGPDLATLVVTTPGGTATGTDIYLYVPAPTITGVSQDFGPTAGGTPVIVVGTNFMGGPFNGISWTTSLVTFGSATSACTVTDAAHLDCTSPAHAAGMVSIAATTPGGTTAPNALFTYIPPMTDIVPNFGPLAGGTTVVITGSGPSFIGATAVTFGGTPATTYTVNSATQITAVTPAHAVGMWDVIVTAPAGTTTYTNGFTFYGTPLLPLVAGSDPADGSFLLETQNITSLKVAFNMDMIHVSSGPGWASSALNPANYMLVEEGTNEIIDTQTCAGGPQGDDWVVTINSVTYDDVAFTATLNVNNGHPLPAGQYRFFVCGTTSIKNLAGVKLNGGLDDARSNFVITPVAAKLPATGFAPDRVTVLPFQTVSYTALGDLWLEIPRLGVKMPIVGVPQSSDGTWDVSWLNSNAGWLNGSAFPTWAGNSVLTAHAWNADNTAGPFRYINTLWWGDKIIIHAGDAQYVYEVRSVQQVAPGSTAAMLKHENLPWVTLVTCRGYDLATGQYQYRVLVRAVLLEVK